mmetsp:Transcript_142728/g.248899  ORF Transcript_142728/g.248899 Transcript_142728/m.248899 type:complete len:891 (-) Transcript_142728:154-2826(-)
MCFQCIELGRLVVQVPERPDKLWHKCSFVVPERQSEALTDKGAQVYLQDVLKTLPGFHAIDVDGDGNCLVHALSRCMCGIEVLYSSLRSDLREELLTNIEFYMDALGEWYDEDTLQAELLEAAEEAAPGSVDESELGCLSHYGKSLSPLHVFALANLLRRPIVLYSAKKDWGNSNAGVYLPAREGVRLQEDKTPVAPLFVSWSSSQLGHFVSLMPASEDHYFAEFRVPSSALPRTAEGQLLMFGPYDEAACQPYMQDGCFVVGMRQPDTLDVRTYLDKLRDVWQELNPGSSWALRLFQGTMQHQQQQQVLKLLAGGGLDDPAPVSNYETKKQRAAEQVRLQAQERGESIVYTAPLFDRSADDRLDPLAQAAFEAIFARHTGGSDEQVMSKSQMNAWLQICEADSFLAESILSTYGEEDTLSRSGFITYYLEACETRPKAVWRDLILHDFGFDLQPIGDEAKQYWADPSKQAEAEAKTEAKTNSTSAAVWEVLMQLYGWTRLIKEVEDELEDSFQKFQRDEGPSKVALTVGHGGYLVDIVEMTLEELETSYNVFTGKTQLMTTGPKQAVRRREASESESKPESESALPSGIGGLLQTLSQNLSDEQRERLLSGFAYGMSRNAGTGMTSQHADMQLVDSLVAMGFAEPQARKACVETRNLGVDEALEWLLSHPDEEEDALGEQPAGVTIEEIENVEDAGASPTSGQTQSEGASPAANAPSPAAAAAKGGYPTGGAQLPIAPAPASEEKEAQKVEEAAATQEQTNSSSAAEEVDSSTQETKDSPEDASDAPKGVAQQLTSLQDQQTSKVRVYLGGAVLQKASCTEDLSPLPPPTLERAISMQPPSLQRHISLQRSSSNESSGAAQLPIPLSRAISAPPRLGLDWSRAWACSAK